LQIGYGKAAKMTASSSGKRSNAARQKLPKDEWSRVFATLFDRFSALERESDKLT